jgi:hypothetical protein
MIYRATLVFKVLSNLAFKNIPKNGQKPFQFSFCILAQNLCKIFSWSLKQSCRELNSKQLLFLDQFAKMLFTCSNFEFGAVWLKLDLKNKKKRSSFSCLGHASPSAHCKVQMARGG